ncbi:AAA family ATPase [Alicyclobacillus tolerans]|uniref:AAA family ATPase n=1 Tax=Alicyclobacillus tolerans TaxID=90970 RepID=UPI003B75DD5F
MAESELTMQETNQAAAVIDAVCKRIIGQKQVVKEAFAAILVSGHILFEDIPGTGKTTLANTIARVLGLSFQRIQGTPDLLPSDITGTLVLNPTQGDFSFRKGPIFTQLLLMDEINRATPRTQSALLEAMAERQVSVDGVTYALEAPFCVMATANPIESQGVFPLPEAQLDRFLVQLKLGYVTADEELEMVFRHTVPPVMPEPILSAMDLLELQNKVQKVKIHSDVLTYLVHLCRATREDSEVLLGASPRAIVALSHFVRAMAWIEGRDFVTPDDVQTAIKPILRHRIVFRNWSSTDSEEQFQQFIDRIVDHVPVPTEWEYSE